jgi:hypothetical protein
MSTPAPTLFRTREFDGMNPANASHIWRDFHGKPTANGNFCARAHQTGCALQGVRRNILTNQLVDNLH